MTEPRYWGYYEYVKPIEVKKGIKAKSKRGAIGEKWWSKRFVSPLESFNIGARLGRGRSYARKGQVISIAVGARFKGGALKKASILPLNAPYAYTAPRQS